MIKQNPPPLLAQLSQARAVRDVRIFASDNVRRGHMDHGPNTVSGAQELDLAGAQAVLAVWQAGAKEDAKGEERRVSETGAGHDHGSEGSALGEAHHAIKGPILGEPVREIINGGEDAGG
ncbi:hypothetical protein HYQ46_008642 [Verticillium longisporum]|nr:hypothetical protein HYQ46_008642 [Verticillium longisporum]